MSPPDPIFPEVVPAELDAWLDRLDRELDALFLEDDAPRADPAPDEVPPPLA